MAAERSEKSCRQSLFGGGWISSGQWLAEAMCARIAKKKKEHLPQKFWELPEWLRVFKFQLKKANDLLKSYDADTICTVLRGPGKNIYSLGAKGMLIRLLNKELYLREQKRVVEESFNKSIITQEEILDEPVRPAFIPQNSLSKLRGL
jgi:hypothetical protein